MTGPVGFFNQKMKLKFTFEWRRLSQIFVWLLVLGLFLYSGYKVFTFFDLGQRIWGWEQESGCSCDWQCPSCSPCPCPTRPPRPSLTPTLPVATATPTQPTPTPSEEMTPTPTEVMPTPTLPQELSPTPSVTLAPTLTVTPSPTLTPTPTESAGNGGNGGNGNGGDSQPSENKNEETSGQILGAAVLAATSQQAEAWLAQPGSFENVTLRENSPQPRLKIVALGIDLPIFSQVLTDGHWVVPEDGVGYLQASGTLGEAGNAVLYGHSRPGLLAPLREAALGTLIQVTDAGGEEFLYRVTAVKTVNPQTVAILAPTSTATLTIYTCSGWQDTERLVVRAQLETALR